MKQGKYSVAENRRIAPQIYRMRLAGDTSGFTAPGQFLNIRIDGLFAEACTNAKASPANVSIYTIAFSIPGDPIDTTGQTLLQNCASSGQYFLANDSNGLIAAFSKIANSIGALRISQ